MSTATLSRDLEALQGSLEELLSCYESEQFPEVVSVDATWKRVSAAFDGVQAELTASPDSRGSVQERIDTCLRLYAVASGLLVQRRDEMSAVQASCSSARRTLRLNRADGDSGGSCDLDA